MKFTILSIRKKHFSWYPCAVTVRLEDGRVLIVSSWKPGASTFLYHIKTEIQSKLEALLPKPDESKLVEDFLNKTFDTDEI